MPHAVAAPPKRRIQNPAPHVPCEPPEAVPIIHPPALLRLAEWLRQRRGDTPGSEPCPTTADGMSPPAPTDARAGAGGPLADAPTRPAPPGAPGADTPGPAQPAPRAGRRGGDA